MANTHYDSMMAHTGDTFTQPPGDSLTSPPLNVREHSVEIGHQINLGMVHV